MARLSSKDFLRAHDIARSLLESPNLAALQGAAMNLLGDLLSAGMAGFNDIASGGQIVGGDHNRKDLTRLTMDSLPEFLAFFPRHPLWKSYVTTKRTDAKRISDLVSRRNWEKSELFNSFYRRVDGPHQVSFVVQDCGPIVTAFTLLRDGADFTDTEIALLNLIRPYLSCALSNACERGTIRISQAVLGKAVESEQTAIMIVDQQGNVRWATRHALHLFSQFNRASSSLRIPDALRSWCALVTGQLVLFPRRELPSRTFLIRKGIQSLEFRCALYDGLYCLELKIKSSASSLPENLVRSLTSREHEVLTWLVEGKSDREISIILGERKPVSIRKVEAHVRSLLNKMGFENRKLAIRSFSESAAQRLFSNFSPSNSARS